MKTKYTYHPVGSIVIYKEQKLLVKKQQDNKPVCNGCYFGKHMRKKLGLPSVSCCQHGFMCTASQRKDKNHVIFLFIP